mmetsp:Transcript_33029/g.80281  ORF Transcript_33029/g.80281 Transcript_33029/m.80281 type:complete len:88 (+) Transcript_33029:1185-1448(+)
MLFQTNPSFMSFLFSLFHVSLYNYSYAMIIPRYAIAIRHNDNNNNNNNTNLYSCFSFHHVQHLHYINKTHIDTQLIIIVLSMLNTFF